MPVWHERTRKLEEAGGLQVVGLIQEQHPDRCRLFLEWKGMGWPVFVDSLNVLGVYGVPAVYLIDENGVVRGRGRALEKLSDFVEKRYERPADLPPPADFPDVEAIGKSLQSSTRASARPESWMAYGDGLFLRAQSAFLSKRPERRDTANGDLTASIRAYRKSIELGAPPEASFRLGVALRRRYETEATQPTDFQEALACWGKALDRRPNQYIWRRRIQQYGPRLEKPYAFYDWVDKARAEITARGGKPAQVLVEPRGAEIAQPSKEFPSRSGKPKEPDPDGRIRADRDSLIRIETAVAPAVVQRGKSARVHVTLRPNARKKAHWNNEAGRLKLWLEPPPTLEVDRRLLEAENARTEVSDEPRKLEFEVRVAGSASPGALRVPAYALYFVCEGESGVCYYLRQDLEVKLDIR